MCTRGPALTGLPSCQWRALGRPPLWLREMRRRWTLPANRPRTLPVLADTKNRAPAGNAKIQCSVMTLATWFAPTGNKSIARLFPLEAAGSAARKSQRSAVTVDLHLPRGKQRGRAKAICWRRARSSTVVLSARAKGAFARWKMAQSCACVGG